MKTIELTRGQVAIVDDCDADLAEFKWYAELGRKPIFPFYAKRRAAAVNGHGAFQAMHRVILARMLNRQLAKSEHVDHRSGDGLDNRRENLRLATHSQNQANHGPNRLSTTGLKGVSFSKRHSKWQAHIWNGKSIGLGLFDSIIDAAVAYDLAAIRLQGEFAYTNYSRSTYVSR